MFVALAVIPLTTQLLLPVADTPPTFDVTPSCHGAMANKGDQATLKSCLDSEQKAHDQLLRDWSQFTPANRAMCRQVATIGGEPTYSELITCLEMQRDAKQSPSG
jgi:hypothetical protein